MNADISKTIFNQLGGNRFAVMTGSKNFAAIDSGLMFKVGRNAKSVTHVIIKLDGSDTYEMTFLRCHGHSRKIVSEEGMVYAEQLAEIFESNTGLYTSF